MNEESQKICECCRHNRYSSSHHGISPFQDLDYNCVGTSSGANKRTDTSCSAVLVGCDEWL
jgi:hypothetical protein